ncbi:hypothetical protein BUMB_05199c [Candidatus Paraburkholderia calva]|nr:hypothetical protein BUMB_05199c [Candidatus Paraburkholderia calva]
MHWWTDAPGVLAGHDLTGGGTWLGVSRDGRFAALTNYRARADVRSDVPTRGTLVSAFLAGERMVPMAYLRRGAGEGHRYNGFNLLAGDFTRRELGWYGNRADAASSLDQMIDILRDPCMADEDKLPATGLSIERERVLSAAFIETPEYGTRSTTALRVQAVGNGLSLTIKERSDDDGSHRIVRSGRFECAFELDIAS